MKNKKVTYILLPLALFIWGIIIYKIFFYKDTQENNVFVPRVGNVKEQSRLKLDTFALQLNYQDPFLKNVGRTATVYNRGENNQSAVKKTKEPAKPAKKEVETVVFPALKYEGIVKHISQGKALVIVNVDGKSTFVQTGETFNNIKLVEVYNDSIIVSYEKQNKTIRKK